MSEEPIHFKLDMKLSKAQFAELQIWHQERSRELDKGNTSIKIEDQVLASVLMAAICEYKRQAKKRGFNEKLEANSHRT